MSNKYDNLKDRTKKFSLDVIKVVETLPKNDICKIIGHQLLRAGTSVGANYRSSCRTRSSADFISRITIYEEEADESCYWFELLFESAYISESIFSKMHKEGTELTAIFAASAFTAKKNKNFNKSGKADFQDCETTSHSELRISNSNNKKKSKI